MIQMILVFLGFALVLTSHFSAVAQGQPTSKLPAKAKMSPAPKTAAPPAKTNAAQKDNLFEGYYKINSSNKHIGYMALRFEFDPKKKEFTSTQFMRIETDGTQTSESLVARSDENFTPLAYEYTQLSAGSSTIIDAQFRNGKMTANFSKNGVVKKISKDLPKGTFLSTYLVYMMMKSPTGLTSQTKFQYQAIAEEDADVFKGEATVGKEENFKGVRTLKVINKFKNVSFTSYLTDRGEIMGTGAEALAIATELVPRREDAIAAFNPSEKTLIQLYGQVPEGKNNLVAKNFISQNNSASGSKQEGVPAGIGIQVKSENQVNEK